MDGTTVRMLTLAAAGALAVGAAGTAAACQQCLTDPYNGGNICWDGFDSGTICIYNPGSNCGSDGPCSGDTYDQAAVCDYNRWAQSNMFQGCS